jgi:hypothetical protein
MKLGASTKVHELLSTYPFIKDYLLQLHPHFKKLNNPIMMQTVVKVATLNMAAGAVGIPIDKFIEDLADEIKNRTGKAVEVADS